MLNRTKVLYTSLIVVFVLGIYESKLSSSIPNFGIWTFALTIGNIYINLFFLLFNISWLDRKFNIELNQFDDISDYENGGFYFRIFGSIILSVILLSPSRPEWFINTYLATVIILIGLMIFSMVDNIVRYSIVGSNRLTIHVVLLLILGASLKREYTEAYGSEEIGGFLEKSRYHCRYFVNVFPSENSSKSYYMKADLFVSQIGEPIPDEDYYGQEFFREYSKQVIALETIYWPDGRKSEFSESYLIPNKKVMCIDRENNIWFIVLSNKKVD